MSNTVVACMHACLVTSNSLWPYGLYRAHQAPLFTGFSRQEYWSELLWPSLGDLPNPGIKPTSLMSPALAGGFFTTSATWEAQCDLTSVCDSSSAQIKLLKFLLVISVQRKGSWRLVLGVCGHRRAEEKKTDNQCSHIYVLAGNWGALLRIERMVTQLSKWFLNLSFEIISYWIVSSSY